MGLLAHPSPRPDGRGGELGGPDGPPPSGRDHQNFWPNVIAIVRG